MFLLPPKKDPPSEACTGDAKRRGGLLRIVPPDEFERLVNENRQGLYRIAYRLTGNPDDAEDLLSEALREARTGFARFQPGTNFTRWVATIMTHTFLDWKRKSARLELVPLDGSSEDDSAEPTEIADPTADPQAEALRNSFMADVQRALDTLPAEFKTVCVLVDIEGLNYEEAAAATGCPVGTVRSRLHRARHLLREQLTEYL